MNRNVYDDVIRGDRLPVKERTFYPERNTDRDNKVKTNYNDDVVKAQVARDSQYHDTDPMMQKEGFLGMDDLDRLRRRHVQKIY